MDSAMIVKWHTFYSTQCNTVKKIWKLRHPDWFRLTLAVLWIFGFRFSCLIILGISIRSLGQVLVGQLVLPVELVCEFVWCLTKVRHKLRWCSVNLGFLSRRWWPAALFVELLANYKGCSYRNWMMTFYSTLHDFAALNDFFGWLGWWMSVVAAPGAAGRGVGRWCASFRIAPTGGVGKAGGWVNPPEFQVGRFWRVWRKNGAVKFLPKLFPKKLGLDFFCGVSWKLKDAYNKINLGLQYDYERKEWQWCKPYCQVKVRYFTKAMISPEGGLVIWSWWLEMLGNISPRAHI